MIYLNLAISLLIPFILGYTLLLFLFGQQSFTFSLRIALAYGLGLGLLAIWMLGLGISQKDFNVPSIGMPPLILSVLLLGLNPRKKYASLPLKQDREDSWSYDKPSHRINRILHGIFIFWILIYIFLNIYYVFWRSLTFPISTWDAIATIAFKAKIFYFEQSLPPLDYLPHRTYPLFIPFIESWIALNLGDWNDLLINIIFPMALLSYLIVHYKFLAYFTNKTWALLGCALLLSSNLLIFHATISYQDLFLMYFNCITIMLLILWNKTKISPLLILAGLFAGFATFTKLEGTAFLSIYFILFAVMSFSPNLTTIKEKLFNTARFCAPSIGIASIFHIYKIWNNVLTEGAGIVDKTKIDFTWEKLALIPEILNSFRENLFFSGNWGIVWFMLLISLVHFPRKKHNAELKLLGITLVLFFGLYFSTALFTINFIWIAGDLGSTGLSRLFLHFYPLSVLLIVLLNYPLHHNE
jgi:hypothetical protein